MKDQDTTGPEEKIIPVEPPSVEHSLNISEVQNNEAVLVNLENSEMSLQESVQYVNQQVEHDQIGLDLQGARNITIEFFRSLNKDLPAKVVHLNVTNSPAITSVNDMIEIVSLLPNLRQMFVSFTDFDVDKFGKFVIEEHFSLQRINNI